MEYSEFFLVPMFFEKRFKIGIFFITLIDAILISYFWITSVDIIAASIVTLSIIFFTSLPLFPSIINKKILCSRVYISSEAIRVLYRKKCWREISINIISDIRVEEIEGYFLEEIFNLGTGNVTKEKYICLFLNGNNNIPDVSYAKLYKQIDFFMIAYQEELFKEIVKTLGKTAETGTAPRPLDEVSNSSKIN